MARVVKNLPANAGEVRDTGSILESGRPSGVGNGNPLQYSHQENPMEREAWLATVHRIPKSQTWLKWLSAHTHTHTHTHTQEVASEGNTQTTTLLSNNSQQTKALPSSACSFLIHLCSESQRASNFISDRNGCICYFYYILWFGVEKKWWTLYKKLMHMCVNLKKKYYMLYLVAELCSTLWDPMDCSPPDSVHENSPGKNTGVGFCALLQGIFPTQGCSLPLNILSQ